MIQGERAKARKRFEECAQARAALLEEDVLWLMRQERGRRLAYWLAYELGGIHGAVFAFDLQHNVELYAAWRDGRRSLAGDFLDVLKELTPDHFLVMVAEQTKARIAEGVLEKLSEEAPAPGDDPE